LSNSKYKNIALAYDFLDWPFEYFRYKAIRKNIFSGLSGHILDAGIGTGRNIIFYPKNSNVIGIDNSTQMLKISEKRLSNTNSDNITLVANDVQSCAFRSNTFDSIVVTFMFCTLNKEQQLEALKELHRVLKPNGIIKILDYNYSQIPIRKLIMKIWAPWVYLAYGAGFNRALDINTIKGSGLKKTSQHFVYKDMISISTFETSNEN
tara:strand:- start:2733 stop:3353 length:621 start_codon:yes stop_codon:yes gene_type:complete